MEDQDNDGAATAAALLARLHQDDSHEFDFNEFRDIDTNEMDNYVGEDAWPLEVIDKFGGLV